MTPEEQFRSAVLKRMGAGEAETAELLVYNSRHFDLTQLVPLPAFPLPDESFAADWADYLLEMETSGTIDVLSRVLIQLQFPIRSGISQSTTYLEATKQGKTPGDKLAINGVELQAPDQLEVKLHATAAGRIPVIIPGTRADFVRLIQALTAKNEPVLVPDSLGAMMVGGYRNWDRLRRARMLCDTSTAPPKELYQDRFILLSRGPYSGVPCTQMGLEEQPWMDQSLQIRLEHESAHYFTRRLLGSMKNNLLDEMLADYAGISAVQGQFRADWLLRFLGLLPNGGLQPQGRIRNYRGTPPLSDRAFETLQALVRSAALQLEQFDTTLAARSDRTIRTILCIVQLTLEELASDEGSARLEQALLRLR